MAATILEDRERRNLDSAPGFFNRIVDPDLPDAEGGIEVPIFPALDAIGSKDFFLDTPQRDRNGKYYGTNLWHNVS